MAAAPKLTMTEAEYLEYDRTHEGRHEYVNGEVIAMAGASAAHEVVCANVARRLGNQLDGRPCRVLTSNMRTRIAETGLYAYPDLAVVCGVPKFLNTRPQTLLNPSVLVEVLSEATEAYDRGAKWAHYRRRASLQAYVLISIENRQVEAYLRGPERWAFDDAAMGGVLRIATPALELRPDELFDGVDEMLAGELFEEHELAEGE